MIEFIFEVLAIFYLLFGFIAWRIGMSTFGGDKAYKAYIKRELNCSSFFYYVVFFVFIFLWPLFIRKRE